MDLGDGRELEMLDDLAVAVGEHLDNLGVARVDWVRIGKVAEEGGEALGALIKRTQGRATTSDIEDELADAILAALGGINQLGIQASAILARRWAQVSARTRDSLTKSASAQDAERDSSSNAMRACGSDLPFAI